MSDKQEPYAWEFGRSNGDGTFSVFIERRLPKITYPDWPVKALYTADYLDAITRMSERAQGIALHYESAYLKSADECDALRKQRDESLAIPENRHLELLQKLQIGGCTCITKTPELKFHAEDCHYRVAAEIELMITSASKP